MTTHQICEKIKKLYKTQHVLLGLWIARQLTIRSDPRVGVNNSQFEPRTIHFILS